MFLAEGVSALPEDQLEMVDKLVEQLQRDPEGGMQQIMEMMQQSAESMGDAGAAPLKLDQWGGAGPVDDIFASLAEGKPVGSLHLNNIFLPQGASTSAPLLLSDLDH